MTQEKIDAVKIAPSFLTADFSCLGEQVREAEAAGADYIHLDVMDGHFVPPITFGPLVVAAVRRGTGVPLDVHLMAGAPLWSLLSAPTLRQPPLSSRGHDHGTLHYPVAVVVSRHIPHGVYPLWHLCQATPALPDADLNWIRSVTPLLEWGRRLFDPGEEVDPLRGGSSHAGYSREDQCDTENGDCQSPRRSRPSPSSGQARHRC